MPDVVLPEDPVPADKVERLFGKLAAAALPAPSVSGVVTRGRQRRRHTRIGVSAAAVAVIAAATAGAYQVASLASGHGRGVGPAGNSPSPALTGPRDRVLPPAGSGLLILGVDAANRVVMARTGATAAPVPVASLPSAAGFPWQIATSPAGGWVVTYPTGAANADLEQPSRLATVTPAGAVHPFGPAFGRNKSVISMAVSLDGSRLAIVVVTRSGSHGAAAITILPMPGFHSGTRTWTFPPGSRVNWAKDLSWAPGGRDLTYAAGVQTGAGIGGNPSTLDTAAAADVAPVDSGWPPYRKGPQCHPDTGAWLGDTGRFAAVEECDSTGNGLGPWVVFQPADPGTGTPTGPAITLPGAQPGCGSAMIDSSPDGRQILIGYCNERGLFLDTDGKISRLPGSLADRAAWAGAGLPR
jgi:hypothetical protein